MQAGSIWKRFRRRLRYWLNQSERQRLLWEEMEFHIESMAQDLVAQDIPEAEARAPAPPKNLKNKKKKGEPRGGGANPRVGGIMHPKGD
jgi:hypothetical protein